MRSEEFARGCKVSEINETNNLSCDSGCCAKLHVYNWLEDIPKTYVIPEIVEVRFKNTRKGFYRNVNQLNIRVGDIIAVEASPGHDIGIVSLTGELINQQMKKFNIDPESELKKVYRKAKGTDIEKWREAIDLEHETMIEARKIAKDLRLDMKIGDVEYQGDKTKAIFYYIADDRVDFRELIKVLADRFKIRIEMRQIGARQEAGRIGGIGSCGRELCCSTWITNFVSVTTNAARYQELSLNPQKLAGQCSKLKCCLNYELDNYLDARRDFPEIKQNLKLKQGEAILEKTDIFKKTMWFSINDEKSTNLFPIHVDTVKEIIDLNKKGHVVDINLSKSFNEKEGDPKLDYENVVGKESITRFEEKKKRGKRKKPHRRRNEK